MSAGATRGSTGTRAPAPRPWRQCRPPASHRVATPDRKTRSRAFRQTRRFLDAARRMQLAVDQRRSSKAGARTFSALNLQHGRLDTDAPIARQRRNAPHERRLTGTERMTRQCATTLDTDRTHRQLDELEAALMRTRNHVRESARNRMRRISLRQGPSSPPPHCTPLLLQPSASAPPARPDSSTFDVVAPEVIT